MTTFKCNVVLEEEYYNFFNSEIDFDSELLDFAGYETDIEDEKKYELKIKMDYTPQTYDSPEERILEVIDIRKV